MVIITPQIKDLVLADILSAEEPSFIFNYQDSKNEYGISPAYINIILDQFVELGLIKLTYLIGSKAKITIQAKAMDLHRHGGFTVEEELLKGNIEKLGLELDVLSKQLSPNYTEKATQIPQIASMVMQGLTLFK